MQKETRGEPRRKVVREDFMKGFEELGRILCKRRQGESCRRKDGRGDFMKEFEELWRGFVRTKVDKGERRRRKVVREDFMKGFEELWGDFGQGRFQRLVGLGEGGGNK